MACTEQLAAWQTAHEQMISSKEDRRAAQEAQAAAEANKTEAESQLTLADEALQQANANLAAAEQAVVVAAEAADELYSDYLQCVIGDPETSAGERQAALSALHALLGSFAARVA